ncbi:hypothetical protein D3C75_1023210 [compost metagenome]
MPVAPQDIHVDLAAVGNTVQQGGIDFVQVAEIIRRDLIGVQNRIGSGIMGINLGCCGEFHPLVPVCGVGAGLHGQIQIGRCLADGDGEVGQGAGFIAFDLLVKSVGQGQNQRNTDNPDTGGKSSQPGSPFFRGDVPS